MINAATLAAAAALVSSVEARLVENGNERAVENIAMAPAVRWDNVVPPMRRNGAAWQPKHSIKRKNKIRRQRVAGGRA